MRMSRGIQSVVALLLSTACTGAPDVPYPTDAELLARFTDQRDGFERLAANLGDSATAVGLSLPATRPEVYFGGDTAAHYMVWYKDLPGPGGCAKGFAYLSIAPGTLVDSIPQGLQRCPPGQHTDYRHIGGNWYLYFDARD